jgi:hypothetical protein
MVISSGAVLGVIGGLLGIPAGTRTFRTLVNQLAHGIGITRRRRC